MTDLVRTSIKIAERLTRTYDRKWLVWQPSILRAIAERGHEALSEEEAEALAALQAVLRDDEVLKNAALFENVALAFAGKEVVPDLWQGITPLTLAHALSALYEILGEDVVREGMQKTVRGYIATTLFDHRLVAAPRALRFDVARSQLRALLGSSEPEENMRRRVEGALRRSRRAGKLRDGDLRVVINDAPDGEQEPLANYLMLARLLDEAGRLGPLSDSPA